MRKSSKAKKNSRPRLAPDANRFAPLPGAISHIRSRHGLAGAWRKMSMEIFNERVVKGMPPFVERLASTFVQADPDACANAITRGDPAYFVAFLVRLDQIDCALVAAGRDIAARTPVIRARYIIDGFREASAQGLVQLGGVWPPRDPRAVLPTTDA